MSNHNCCLVKLINTRIVSSIVNKMMTRKIFQEKATSSLNGLAQNARMIMFVGSLAIAMTAAGQFVNLAFGELPEDKTTEFFESVGSEMVEFAPNSETHYSIVVTASPDLHEDNTDAFFTANGFRVLEYSLLEGSRSGLVLIVVVAEVVL